MSTPTRTPRKVGAPKRDRQRQGVIVAPEKVDDPKAERVLWDLASQVEGLGGRGSVGGDWLKNPLRWPEGFVIEIDKWRTTAPIRWKVYEKSKRTHGKGIEFWLNDEKIIDAENNITASMVDHGGLGGLTDDDHTQYARTDGSRDITGLQDFNSSIRLKQEANTNYLTLAQGADATRTVTFPDATTTLAGLSLAQTFTAANSFITPSGTAVTIGTDNTTKDIVIGEITGATAYVGIGLRGSLALSGASQANFYSSSGDSILYINNNNHINFRINNVDILQVLSSEDVLLKDARSMLFGTGQDAGFEYNVSQTPDAFLLGVGADSNGLVITKKGNIAGTFDFAHALETDPTLFIHDATLSTTAFTKFQHGVLEANVGNLSLTGKGGHVRIRSGANVNYTELRQASDAAASATFPASAITVAGKDIDNAFTATQTFNENISMAALKTVDGRDVSADGTKLDGIESGATADQTAAEILAALLTVDGAGSLLDADLLDGLSSLAFLKADGTVASTGLQTFNAGIATDTVAEKTAAAGVTVDGVLLKDGGLSRSGSTLIDTSGNLYQAGTLITATAAELNILDGVTLTAAQINKAAIKDEANAFTAENSFGSQKLTLVADPTSAQDAATKAYVDAVAVGIDWKPSVRVATTVNITLSGTQTIDGVAVIAGDRVLVKNQTAGAENGVYVVAVGAWARSTDADTSAEVTAGSAVFISEGTTTGNRAWVLTTDDPITLGTTALVFTQFLGPGADDHGDLTGLGDAADHTWAALVDGTRAITGAQVFNEDIKLKPTKRIYFDDTDLTSFMAEVSDGVIRIATASTAVADFDSTGLQLQQNLKFLSGTSFAATLDHAITANRTFTLPDESMTLAGRDVANTFTEQNKIVESDVGLLVSAVEGSVGATTSIRLGYNSGAAGTDNWANFRARNVTVAGGGADVFLEAAVAAGAGGSTWNTNQLVLTANNKVGVGVAAPDELLDVAGKIRFAGSAGGGDVTLDFNSASNYTLTLPNATTTLGGLGVGQTWTGLNVFSLYLELQGDASLAPTKRLYFDGPGVLGDTYVSETAANVVEHFTGNVSAIKLKATGFTSPGGVIVPFTFYDPNISGTATGEATPTEAGGVNYEYVMPLAGSLVAISVALNTASTAGTATFKVTINGAPQDGPFLTISDLEQYDRITYAIGARPFAAGDRLGLELTSVGFTPTTADAQIIVLVSFNTGAIA